MTMFRRDFSGDPTYNPFERPSMPLASLALDGVLGSGGNNESGEDVDVVKGLSIPTAQRCIRILSTVVASCTLEEIDRGTQEANRWEVLDHLTSYTSFELMELIVAHLAGWGNFFGRKIMVNGKLLDLLPIFPGDVKVIRKKGRKTFRIKKRNDDGNLAVGGNSSNGEASPVWDDIPDGPDCPIFHVPGFGYDGLQGMSPIMTAAQTVGTTLAANRLAARFYSRGQQLGGIVKVKVPLANQSQADAIKMQWRKSHGGVGNAGDVAVLDSETDFTPTTIAPEALQFLQSREFQGHELATMFGIPAFLIDPSVTWGSGIEQQNIGFVTYTIRGYTDRIEQRTTREFAPSNKYHEFDLDRMMRGSMMERFQAYGQAIGWGWMTGAEARTNERMKSIPGLDKPLQPQAMNGALADGPMSMQKPGGVGATTTAPSNSKQEKPK